MIEDQGEKQIKVIDSNKNLFNDKKDDLLL